MKRKKTSKLFFASLISLACAASLSGIVYACGGWSWEDEHDDNLFNQELGCDKKFQAFFYSSWGEFYNSEGTETYDFRAENVQEWRAYMQDQPKAEDVDSLVYSSSEAVLLELSKNAKKGKVPLNAWMRGNTAVNFLLSKKDEEAATYLHYARRCEPQALAGRTYYYSWETPVRDTATMLQLIEEGKKSQLKAKSTFIRERYAFQVIRLSRYVGKANDAVEHYEAFYGKNTIVPSESSSIAQRALSAKAGALRDLRRYGEAKYIFAMLFDKHYEDDWAGYARSFRFSEGEESVAPDAYHFCRSHHERVAVLALENMLEGVVPEAKALEQMHAWEPGTPYLQVLLLRHLRQAQDLKSRAESRRIVREIIEKGVSCPQLWKFSAGYLAYLDGDYRDAEDWYASAERSAQKDSLMLDHIKVMRIVQNAAQLAQVGTAAETRLFAEMQVLNEVGSGTKEIAEGGRRHVMRRLAELYEMQGDSIKSIICQSLGGGNWSYASPPEHFPLDKMIAFMERKDTSPFENYITSQYAIKLSDCYEWKGLEALREYRYKDAIAYFKKGEDRELWADPFLVNTKDCHDCDYRAAGKEKKLTRKEFTQRLIELEKLAAQPGPQQADYCLQYGMGLYNMTYYGNSWMATRNDRDHGRDYSGGDDDVKERHMDCSKAMSYFDKAMKLTKDKELAAKCCFLAARCEQKMYFIEDGGAADEQTDEYHTYFSLLKSNYYNTLFYKQALRECSYFDKFVKY